MQWIIHENCHCTLPYDFSVQDGYFACATSDYVIFRAKLVASFDLMDLISLKANFLSNLIAGKDRKTKITIYGATYVIEPGPCGLTAPELNSPHCLDSASTQQTAASSPPQDTTVTIVVAIMSAAMVLVVLSGCTALIVSGLQKRCTLHAQRTVQIACNN